MSRLRLKPTDATKLPKKQLYELRRSLEQAMNTYMYIDMALPADVVCIAWSRSLSGEYHYLCVDRERE